MQYYFKGIRVHINRHYFLFISIILYFCHYLKDKRLVFFIAIIGLIGLIAIIVELIFLGQLFRMTILSKNLLKNLVINLQAHAHLQHLKFLVHTHFLHLRLPCVNVQLHSSYPYQYPLLSKTWLVKLLPKHCEILIATICLTDNRILMFLRPGSTPHIVQN